jgi:hypothetical protein
MIYRFNTGSSEPIEVQQLDAIHNALNPEPEETEVFPLRDIPVSYESDEERIHDGTNSCGRYGCPCMTFGYGVPSLD